MCSYLADRPSLLMLLLLLPQLTALKPQLVDFHGEMVLLLHWSLLNYAAGACLRGGRHPGRHAGTGRGSMRPCCMDSSSHCAHAHSAHPHRKLPRARCAVLGAATQSSRS